MLHCFCILVKGGSGDAVNYQPIFQANSNMESSDKFQPSFPVIDNSKHASNDVAEAYRQAG